jgi:hypothetical protein
MSNRFKVMLLIMLFWVSLEITLLLIGFSLLPVLIFIILGIVISNLIGMYLDLNNTKVHRWFDSTKFFKNTKF